MSLPFGAKAASAWTLDPDIVFLNHGSFGACPRAVLDDQQEWRARLEREPVLFIARELEALLDTVRGELATFVGAQADDVVFVPNATSGVNTVLRSLRFEPGDELLCTSHGYNACQNVLDMVAGLWGAKVVIAPVPFPVQGPADFVEAVMGAVTGKTRFALLDHVTSASGTVVPVEVLVPLLQARGVEVMVDGAHGPGMLALDLETLGADYYTGNCHKWLCTPKGAAFLHVRREHQGRVLPLTVSHGANSLRGDRSRFRLQFDQAATTDPTPFLSIPFALRFFAREFEGGWTGVRAHNHALVCDAQQQLVEGLGVEAACPPSMLGSLATVILPPGDAEALRDALFRRMRIEVPVWGIPWMPKRSLRVSAQVYNHPAQYAELVRAVRTLLAE